MLYKIAKRTFFSMSQDKKVRTKKRLPQSDNSILTNRKLTQ